MKQSVNIVTATAEHTSAIARAEALCFSDAWSESAIDAEIKNCQAVCFTALIDGEVAGYAFMSVVLGEGSLNRLAVLPDMRRMGVGSSLLKSVLNYARDNSLLFVALEVRKSNIGAVTLYESFNFKILGERKSFYSKPVEDAVIMRIEGENI